MFDYKFNTGTTNITISLNLFGIYDPKHLCYKKNDYVSLVMGIILNLCPMSLVMRFVQVSRISHLITPGQLSFMMYY